MKQSPAKEGLLMPGGMAPPAGIRSPKIPQPNSAFRISRTTMPMAQAIVLATE